jgi:hypothetical protein
MEIKSMESGTIGMGIIVTRIAIGIATADIHVMWRE